MKEDVLEQIVDDYLKFNGYFTMHNISFWPREDHPEYVTNEDSVPSDIDVVGVNPRHRGVRKVIAVNCKAWQRGFNADGLLAQLRGERANPRRERWHQFRELWVPKWSEAFRSEIEALTGVTRFSYRIAVTRLRGSGVTWAEDPTIKRNLAGCSFDFLTLETMWSTMLSELTTRPAASEIGRLAQLLKAAGLTVPGTAGSSGR